MITNSNNFSFIEELSSVPWAKEELKFSKKENWQDVYCRETEKVCELYKKEIGKLIKKHDRETVLNTIYKIIEEKSLNYLKISNIYEKFQNTSFKSSDINNHIAKFFELLAPPCEAKSVRSFCLKVALREKEPSYFNPCIKLIGEKNWKNLHSWKQAGDLKQCCDAILPREDSRVKEEKLNLLPANLFKEFRVVKSFEWDDQKNNISNLLKEDVSRSILFFDSSSQSTSFLPASLMFKNKEILKSETSKDPEFSEKCLFIIFKSIESLLFKNKYLPKKTQKNSLKELASSYFKTTPFNSSVMWHEAHEWLKGFTINAFSPVSTILLKENFPAINKCSVELTDDKTVLSSMQDKTFGTVIKMSATKKKVFVRQTKQFIITGKSPENKEYCTYQTAWTLFLDNKKWTGCLTIEKISLKQDIDKDVENLIISTFEKHGIEKC